VSYNEIFGETNHHAVHNKSTTRICSTIIIASSSSSTDHIEYPQKDQHNNDNDNQHSDEDAHNTHRQFAGALLQGEKDAPGRYSLELSLITRPSHPSIRHAVLAEGKVKLVVCFCFLFFATPDGFTTVVANKGLEKARADLNQVPREWRLYIPSEGCGVNFRWKHLQTIPTHIFGQSWVDS